MPPLSAKTERRMKRWQEQRWILDSIIDKVGIEWDQNRIGYTLGPCGPEATFDFMGVRSRVHKFNDIAREFGKAAARREALARRFETEGRTVAARESYFIASLLYGSAQWPLFENSHENITYNSKKVDCYSTYAQFADHPIRRVEIPFEGKSLPGYLHLPSKKPEGKWPCILSLDGMDGFKEMLHSLYGDRFLERGIACLAMDGPGQGECTVRDIHVTETNFKDAGRAAFAWIRSQTELDPDRIALFAVSFGSFAGTQAASVDEKLKGCAVAYVCHEPGFNTLFNMASPSFKLRFMYMAGYEDEDKFDRFAERLTLRDSAEQIKCPYLVIAGEDDELSPIEYTYDLLNTMKSPKQLVLYQGERHALHSTSSSALGPNWGVTIADWIRDRLDDKPMESKSVYVDLMGQTRPFDIPIR